MSEFDTDGTDNAVCPYCGAVDEDSWELEGEEGITECGECGREYEWSRMTIIYYTTEPKEEA